MISLLLAVIYMTFIGLGLPDAILGSAWPSMFPALGVGVSGAGILTMIIASCTIISSLVSDRLIRALGSWRLTTISVGLTAVALLGYSLSNSFWMLLLCSVPYGLGAGSVDTTLNHFVSQNFHSRHMNWMHCFWGVGAALGPYFMGLCLTGGQSWHGGYRLVFAVQLGLVALLVCSGPLWKRGKSLSAGVAESAPVKKRELLRVPGVKAAGVAFFCYFAAELTAGTWASSYLVLSKGLSEERAAKWVALFYVGITGGRLLSGCFSNRLGDRKMVAIGQGVLLGGLALLLLPGSGAAQPALFLIGCGCAPILPSLLHATPHNFGPVRAQSIMGLQMACAYLGSALMPPLFGVLADRLGLHLYPLYLLGCFAVMVLAVGLLNRAAAAEISG